MEMNEITKVITGSAIEVNKMRGACLPESTCEECLCYELINNGLKAERQKAVPEICQDIRMDVGYRPDILDENLTDAKLKVAETIISVREAQILRYMKLSMRSAGLPMNFYVMILKHGIAKLKL